MHGCNGLFFREVPDMDEVWKGIKLQTTTSAVQGVCARLLKLPGLHDLIVKCLRMGFVAAASFLTKCCRAV